MLYSKQYKFIFVHIFKTGGTSVTESLKRQILLKRPFYQRLLGFKKNNLSPCEKHAIARKIRDEIGVDHYQKAFSFAFVRNPFDLEVSLYKYLKRWKKGPQYSEVSKITNFNDFVLWRQKSFRLSQKDFITNEKGEIIVSYIAKFEKIEKEFEFIAKKLNLKPNIKKLNKSIRKNYQSYYNDKSIEIISSLRKDDIEMFNYKF